MQENDEEDDDKWEDDDAADDGNSSWFGSSKISGFFSKLTGVTGESLSTELLSSQ